MESFSEILNNDGVYIMRMLLAMLFGGLIGLERQVRGRSAGLRTNILVCLGSAAIIVAFQKLSTDFNVGSVGSESVFRLDPARAAAGVITGIGFLGAGSIIKSNNIVRGLTTAASIWVVAAVGVTVGLGEYAISIVLTLLVLIALYLFHLLPIKEDYYYSLLLDWHGDAKLLHEVETKLQDASIHIKTRSVTSFPKEKELQASLVVCIRGIKGEIPVISELQADSRFDKVEWK